MQSKQKSMISIGEYSKYSLKYNPYVLLEKLTLIEDRTKYERFPIRHRSRENRFRAAIGHESVDCCNKIYNAYVLLERLSPNEIQSLL